MSRPKVVFLIGNGFSIGIDRRYHVQQLTQAVVARLDEAGIGPAVRELTRAYAKETPAGEEGITFEGLAGAVDRTLTVFEATRSLPELGLQQPNDLLGPSSPLRDLGVQIAGTVLSELDGILSQSAGYGFDDRRNRATKFGGLLWDLADEGLEVCAYTLNYDTLLMQGLLEAGKLRAGPKRHVYDGFPWGPLDEPLGRWEGRIGIYHLHGSLAWYTGTDGRVHKRKAEQVRLQGILDQWALGSTEPGRPTVVLGDRKHQATTQSPFSSFYDELSSDLRMAQQVIVGGYGFGDYPVNRRLGDALNDNPDLELQIWSPDATTQHQDRLARLQSAARLTGADLTNQVQSQDLCLPDGAGVAEQIQSLHAERRAA